MSGDTPLAPKRPLYRRQLPSVEGYCWLTGAGGPARPAPDPLPPLTYGRYREGPCAAARGGLTGRWKAANARLRPVRQKTKTFKVHPAGKRPVVQPI